ncbi:MAG: S9 family peptidase [Vicinamibacteria bacterium]|nr:S9 family peptidase [Vicinamibacteria bacterium]MCL4821406.1 S9 family peptidase [Vicinamibacteria bacterium]
MSARPALLLAACALAAPAPAAAPPRVLDKATFFQMESVAGPQISPDGSRVVFARGFVDLVRDQNQANLWLVEWSGDRLRQLSDGAWRDTGPAWSPDGKRLAFVSNRSGSNQVHVMWVDTRETLQLTRVEHEPANLRWSPDGKQVAFTMRLPDEKPVLPVKLPKTPKGAQLAKGATVVDRTSWGRDGVGPIAPGYVHVFTVDAVAGGTPRQVTRGDYDHGAFDWSLDGRTLFVSGIRKPDAEYLREDSEIYAVDVATSEAKALTDRSGPDTNPLVSPDGRHVAYTGFDQRDFTNHVGSLYVMDSAGGSRRVLAGGLPSTPAQLSWAADGSGVHYSMQEKGVQNQYFAPLRDGTAPRAITAGSHVLSQVSIARNGRAVGVRSTVERPGVLVAFDLAKPAERRELLDVNADVLEGLRLAGAEELWFTARDGVRAQGWLMKPADFDPAKKYPLVLWIHGGPWSMYSVGWNWAWQNFAANGYAVLWTNPRGSTGYGQDFVNGIQHSYPGGDYDDLMAGVDAALARGFVDEKNLFVCGGSGGGVLTAWIVGHTDRFRAAVSMRPVTNWHSFVGTTDGNAWYRQFRKFPWEDPMEYAVRSPLHHVGKVTTPTMVMTGEADLRTPMSQSEEYYRALKMLRKADTLLVRMPEEFHGWRRPSHQLLQQLYLLAWFEKYRTPESRAAIPARDHAASPGAAEP